MNKMVNKLKGVRAKLRNSKGFTLIEMLVVVAIIGILVLLAVPRYVGYTKDANVATMQADVRVLESAALVSSIDEEGWPVTGVPITTGDAVTFVKGKDPVSEVKAIDEAAIEDQIHSLKNDISKYGIITKGKYEGKVIHLDGVEGRDKAENFGSDLVKKS